MSFIHSYKCESRVGAAFVAVLACRGPTLCNKPRTSFIITIVIIFRIRCEKPKRFVSPSELAEIKTQRADSTLPTAFGCGFIGLGVQGFL
jgi:hypothetical protein